MGDGDMTTGGLVYERPWLYGKQEEAFFNEAKIACCEATTKSGKTVGAAAWMIEEMLLRGGEGKEYTWAAPILPQAKIAMGRFTDGLPKGTYEANLAESSLVLVNGSKIWFKSADNPDSLYGYENWGVVIDEASRVGEEAWHALRTTVTATGGKIRLIGNVKGKRNWFWRLCRRAQAGEVGLHYVKITWQDAVAAGILRAEEVEEARTQMPVGVFRELYEAEAAEDQGNPFGEEAIRKCVAPLSREPVAVWGWDLAKSQDWTVGIGLDRGGHVAGFHRFQRPWEETQERIRQEVGMTPALLDATGVGEPVVERLQRDGIMRIEGFVFSRPSKQELMFDLMTAIQGGKVHFPDGPIRLELESFEYEYTPWGTIYRAPDGMYDDCVMALGLAWRHYQAKRVRPLEHINGGRAKLLFDRRW